MFHWSIQYHAIFGIESVRTLNVGERQKEEWCIKIYVNMCICKCEWLNCLLLQIVWSIWWSYQLLKLHLQEVHLLSCSVCFSMSGMGNGEGFWNYLVYENRKEVNGRPNFIVCQYVEMYICVCRICIWQVHAVGNMSLQWEELTVRTKKSQQSRSMTRPTNRTDPTVDKWVGWLVRLLLLLLDNNNGHDCK